MIISQSSFCSRSLQILHICINGCFFNRKQLCLKAAISIAIRSVLTVPSVVPLGRPAAVMIRRLARTFESKSYRGVSMLKSNRKGGAKILSAFVVETANKTEDNV